MMLLTPGAKDGHGELQDPLLQLLKLQQALQREQLEFQRKQLELQRELHREQLELHREQLELQRELHREQLELHREQLELQREQLKFQKDHKTEKLKLRTSDRAGRARAPTHAHPVFDDKISTPTRPARAKKQNGRPPAHWASALATRPPTRPIGKGPNLVWAPGPR